MGLRVRVCVWFRTLIIAVHSMLTDLSAGYPTKEETCAAEDRYTTTCKS
jgi:hypothetical protein